jgi:hypothetical protein
MIQLRIAVASALTLGLPFLSFAQETNGRGHAIAPGPLQYQSAFADYKPYRDLQRGNWKAMIEATRNSGIAQHTAKPPPEKPPASGAPSEPKQYEGHMQHGGTR